jgi:hypothetical protein
MHMALEVERWDGQIKQYHASSSGTAHYRLFDTSPYVIKELTVQVTDNCLTSLLDQVVRDTTFYLASDALPFEADNRTVSVRARRSMIDVLPVSTNLVFPAH